MDLKQWKSSYSLVRRVPDVRVSNRVEKPTVGGISIKGKKCLAKARFADKEKQALPIEAKLQEDVDVLRLCGACSSFFGREGVSQLFKRVYK